AAGAAEIPDDVDVCREWVQHLLLFLVQDAVEPGDAEDDLVRWRLVNATIDVGPGVNAQHVARRRHRVDRAGAGRARERIGDEQPGVVQGRVLGVELLTLRLHIGQAVVRRRWAVEHSEAEPQALALLDQGALHGRRRAARARDDADVLDVAQAEEPGALL